MQTFLVILHIYHCHIPSPFQPPTPHSFKYLVVSISSKNLNEANFSDKGTQVLTSSSIWDSRLINKCHEPRAYLSGMSITSERIGENFFSQQKLSVKFCLLSCYNWVENGLLFRVDLRGAGTVSQEICLDIKVTGGQHWHSVFGDQDAGLHKMHGTVAHNEDPCWSWEFFKCPVRLITINWHYFRT